jgi:drug/metabolite transporter (DMT)-like permease
MTTIDNPRRGIVTMIAAAFSFSIMLAAAKHLAATMPVIEIVFFRALATSLAALPILILLRSSPLGSNPPLVITRGVLGFVALSLNFYAHAHLPLNDASVLAQTSVLFTPVVAFLLLREKITTRIAALTITAFVGVLLIVRPSTEFLNIPGLAGVGSGLLTGIVFVAIRKLHSTDHWSTIVFSFSVISCLGALLVGHSSFRWPTESEIAPILVLGVAGSLGQYLMTNALRYSTAPVVTPYTFTQVVFALIWGMLLWGVVPTPLSILGSVLIVGAGVGILRSQPAIITSEARVN